MRVSLSNAHKYGFGFQGKENVGGSADKLDIRRISAKSRRDCMKLRVYHGESYDRILDPLPDDSSWPLYSGLGLRVQSRVDYIFHVGFPDVG
jgi:hypothetical protein